jgi:hypothetical protein
MLPSELSKKTLGTYLFLLETRVYLEDTQMDMLVQNVQCVNNTWIHLVVYLIICFSFQNFFFL